MLVGDVGVDLHDPQVTVTEPAYGQGGDDALQGELGADLLYGGDDNDALKGRDGAEKLFGNAGDDRLDGGDGIDKCDGGDQGAADAAVSCESITGVP